MDENLKKTLSSLMEFEPYIIYESIVSIFHPGGKKINSACMGVHFTPNDEVYLHVYPNTDTKQLLQEGTSFSINFSEDFYDYARAAILGTKMGPDEVEIPIDEFAFWDSENGDSSVPLLKNAWVSIVCTVLPAPPEILKNVPCRRREIPNVRAKIVDKIVNRLPKIFNNRSMNLALEALILATRIPDKEPYSKEYNHMLSLYRKYKWQIDVWRDMDRFERGFELMDNYLINKGIKPQEVFDLTEIEGENVL